MARVICLRPVCLNGIYINPGDEIEAAEADAQELIGRRFARLLHSEAAEKTARTSRRRKQKETKGKDE